MLDETSYEVKISEVAQVIEVEIVNEYVHGNIKLTKVDEDYPDNKLTGATFEVYKDVNGDGKLDDADELIGTLSETSTGIYEMKELLYGKYLVRETKAPDGFELDKGVYSVFIEKDETTYEVENKAGVGFINTAMKGNLKIVKTSSDGKVEGFTFRVTGVNGYDRSFTTDKNGEIIIEGLRIGDYTISEVQDSVSASYVLPADKIATVKVGSTTVVEMHNELRDTPKTGDNSNVGLWTALAGLSALGKSFIKSYCAVLLEGAVIVLACIIFSLFASTPPVVNPDAAAVTQVWAYIGELVFNMLVLVGAVKMSDRIIREMMGL